MKCATNAWSGFAPLLLFAATLPIALASADLRAASVDPGSTAPVFTLPTLNGDSQIELAQLRGHLVLVDFWASWCGPCAQSLPRYAKLQSEFSARGFAVVAISVDESRTDARAFVAKLGVDLPWAWDGAGATATAYGLSGMPSAFLVDGDGVVRYRLLGFKPRDEQALRTRIIELLDGAKDAP